ncbi:hypothetical protein ACLKMI_12705 [Pseudoalteromonas sp. KJ71-7]|uniref:hypothetical protein n=1 Tax=Pseudoalteromonas sp. KJ71-7 TaxID=3391824 RepID=UPI0039B03C9F
MKFSLKKKKLKVLKSADLDANNILALGQTKKINGGGITVTIEPKDPDVQIPGATLINVLK